MARAIAPTATTPPAAAIPAIVPTFQNGSAAGLGVGDFSASGAAGCETEGEGLDVMETDALGDELAD
jgi:hypothetical protein